MTREDEIFEKLKNGDKSGAGELAELYYADIFRYCLFHVPDRQTAEDAVQETFLKVFRHFEDYRHQGKFRAFLYKVAANVCIDLCSYADYRSGVHHRIGNAGYEVCGSRSRSGNAYACFSGASCIPFGCMNRTLLVPYKYMVDFVGVVV